MIVNGFGAVCTLVVMAVFAITKFTDGAYVVIILLPILVYGFYAIHRHYKNLAKRLIDGYICLTFAHCPPPGDPYPLVVCIGELLQRYGMPKPSRMILLPSMFLLMKMKHNKIEAKMGNLG